MRRPRPKTYLIDQDEHLQNLRKIIKRDFFQSAQQRQQQPQQVIPLGLNDYLKNFKSNQNHIFAELVHNDSQDWKKRYQWMEKSKHLMIQSGKQQKPFTNMIGKSATIKAIDFSNVQQQPKNGVFFSPTRQTKSYNDPQHDRVKKVLFDNCRIQSEQLQRAKKYKLNFIKNPNLQQIPSTPILQGKFREKKYQQNVNQQKQYSIKRAPSPEPEKLPIMTWGQIQSTPMRIPQGPQYKIPETSKRDKILEQLNSKITKEKMIKKTKKDQLKQKLLSSVRMGGSSIRKVSVARQNSQKRNLKVSQSKIYKLDSFLNNQK